jgi:hypothetical protein
MPPSQQEKAELRELTKRLVYDAKTDSETQGIALRIKKISPDPYFLDYIFHDSSAGSIDETIERALEKADKYKPIIL